MKEIHVDQIESRDEWVEEVDKLEDDVVYRFHLSNGFTPELRKTGRTGYVDFRKNEYLIDYRDGKLDLYMKVDNTSDLEGLATVKKIEEA